MIGNNDLKRWLWALSLSAVALLMPLVSVHALTCPVELIDKGIDCSTLGPEYSYCGTYGSGGQCLVESTVACPNDAYGERTRLDCASCSCKCPTAQPLDCVNQAAHQCQAINPICAAEFRNPVCASSGELSSCGTCISGYTDCGAGACRPSTDPSCPAPDVWNACTGTCSFKYVLANPTSEQAPQSAEVDIVGDLRLTGSSGSNGYLYLGNGKRIRVDGSGTTSLGLGNWHAEADPDPNFSLSIRGNLYVQGLGGIFSPQGISLLDGDDSVFPSQPGTIEANQICFGDEVNCRNSWPIGLPTVADAESTLRYDGSVWQANTVLRNSGDYVGINVPNAESLGWPLDIRDDGGTVIVNLDDRIGSLWTGWRLGRKTGTDLNKEQWFMGMTGSDGNKLVLQQDGSGSKKYMTMDTDGRLGLSTTSPQSRLHMMNGNMTMESNVAASSPEIRLQTQEGRDWSFGVNVTAPSVGQLRFSSASTMGDPNFVIGENGWIGVNNASPASSIDVINVQADTPTIARLTQDFPGNYSSGFQLDRQTEMKWFLGMPVGSDDFKIIQGGTPNVDRLAISRTSGKVKVNALQVSTDEYANVPSPGEDILVADNADGSLRWEQKPLGLPRDGLVAGMTLRYDGADWIGTVNLFNSGTRVGINEADPGYPLDIAASASDVSMIRLRAADATPVWTGLRMDRAKGNERWMVGMDSTDDDLIFRRAGSTNDLVVSGSNGNVGVGTNTPSRKLDVNGDTRLGGNVYTDRWLGSDTNTVLGVGAMASGSLAAGGTANTVLGNNSMYLNTTGNSNVAIGADVMINNTTGSRNVAIGREASRFNSTSNDNTAVGHNSLRLNTSYSNTSVGSFALSNNTGGFENTAVGAYTLNANITNAYNTAVGAYALNKTNSGSSNTAVGRYALNANTSGGNNIAVGAGAMTFNTNGGTNTAVGTNSLYRNTGGGNNVAMGYGSLYNNTLGASNTALGSWSMRYVTGSMNTALGYSAGYGNSSGAAVNRNVSVGYQAGSSLSTGGDDNVFFGYQAGDIVTSGSRNIMIGSGADAASPTANDRLNIGNTIYADLASDSVGIGVESPSVALEVAGTVLVNGFTMPTGASDGKVLVSNATGDSYWGVVAFADDCTGGKFSHLTASVYDGNQGSYKDMNTLCGFHPVSGEMYHVCTTEEILRTIRCAPDTLPLSGNMGWVASGPPGFVSPAVNDCKGWQTNDSTSKSYGSYWKFEGENGGYGAATVCSSLLKVTCCTPL